MREELGFVGSGFLGEMLEERAVVNRRGGGEGIVIGVFDVVEVEDEFGGVLFEEQSVGSGPEVFNPDQIVVLVVQDLIEGGFVAGEAIHQRWDAPEGAFEIAEDFWEYGFGVLRERKGVTLVEEMENMQK